MKVQGRLQCTHVAVHAAGVGPRTRRVKDEKPSCVIRLYTTVVVVVITCSKFNDCHPLLLIGNGVVMVTFYTFP